MINQNPEQIARDQIDQQLLAAGWRIQDKANLELNAAPGVVREYQTNVGPLITSFLWTKSPQMKPFRTIIV